MTAFIQAWLYFGLIYEVLGAPQAEFIDTKTDGVTTARLPYWIQKWRKGLPAFLRSKRQAEYLRVQNCLKETYDALTFPDCAKRRELMDGVV